MRSLRFNSTQTSTTPFFSLFQAWPPLLKEAVALGEVVVGGGGWVMRRILTVWLMKFHLVFFPSKLAADWWCGFADGVLTPQPRFNLHQGGFVFGASPRIMQKVQGTNFLERYSMDQGRSHYTLEQIQTTGRPPSGPLANYWLYHTFILLFLANTLLHSVCHLSFFLSVSRALSLSLSLSLYFMDSVSQLYFLSLLLPWHIQ